MLELLDYRRRVHEHYQAVREQGTQHAYAEFRRARDTLFVTHSQSALDDAQKARFQELSYYPYDPAYCVVAPIDYAVDPIEYTYDLSDDGRMVMRQIGQVAFTLPTGTGSLGVFWITGYGGGLFLPFRDATNDEGATYGGGRYLYDTIKGANLSTSTDALVLDFNYAYHPSCYYNARWVCPLAPPQNRLPFPIPVGERKTETLT